MGAHILEQDPWDAMVVLERLLQQPEHVPHQRSPLSRSPQQSLGATVIGSPALLWMLWSSTLLCADGVAASLHEGQSRAHQ